MLWRRNRRFRLHILPGLLAAALSGTAAAPVAQVSIDRMPRLRGRATGAEKVDAALAAIDADNRKRAADCVASAKAFDAGSSFSVGARRLLETKALYSIEIAARWYCGGAYPDGTATALTFDLRTGEPYDLARVFHVGSGHLAAAALPIVGEFRTATLQRGKDAADCSQMPAEDVAQNVRSAEMSLGLTRKYLIFYFGVPHVIAACFPPVQVPLSALSSLTDRAELRRLGLDVATRP